VWAGEASEAALLPVGPNRSCFRSCWALLGCCVSPGQCRTGSTQRYATTRLRTATWSGATRVVRRRASRKLCCGGDVCKPARSAIVSFTEQELACPTRGTSASVRDAVSLAWSSISDAELIAPRLIGMTEADAVRIAESRGCTVNIVEAESEGSPWTEYREDRINVALSSGLVVDAFVGVKLQRPLQRSGTGSMPSHEWHRISTAKSSPFTVQGDVPSARVVGYRGR